MELSDVVRGARQHLTDSTAILTVFTPAGAFLENVLAGMTDEVSLNSRLIVVGLLYGGYGGLMGLGRDISRRLFHLTDQSRERTQQFHDMAYLAAATALTNPVIYAAAGATDLSEIALGTAYATGVALVSGGVVGYNTDLFRDLTGYQPSHRVPKVIRKQKPTFKKMIAAGLVAATVGLTSLIYSLTPDKPVELLPPQTEITQEVPYSK